MIKRVLFIAAMLPLMAGCHKDHEGHEGHDHDHDHDHAGELVEAHEDDEPDGIVVLHDEMAERFGVTVDSVVPASMGESLHCSASISRGADAEAIVAAPTSGIVRYLVNVGQPVGVGTSVASVNPSGVTGGDPNRVAKAALDAAQTEVNRLKPLYEEKLVTAAEFQAAEAALAKAKAEYSPRAAGGRATSSIAGTVTALLAAEGAYVEAGAPLASVTSDSRLTLTARTSADNYSRLKTIKDVRVRTADGRTLLISALGAKGGGMTSDGGYATISFTFNNDGTLAPGSTIEAWLVSEGGDPVISLPLSAVTEQQGEHFVYREVLPEHYLKVPVKLGASDGERVMILSGVNPGDRIVSSGVITLRLAESSGAIPEGHNHNH
ncbi:MAG: efflux RND transporter periplasmic adaptor subunit [Muribaculaceae bacterium]|nr:efflux RND transporter periplasmic adaptor subunit [Muribaculaceae bacterium]